MGSGPEPHTRDEERTSRPDGPAEEPSPGPGEVAGRGHAPGDAPGSGWTATAVTGPAGRQERAGGPTVNGDRQSEPETDGSQAGNGGETGGDGDERGGDTPARSVEVERDEYLDALRRLQADFENYRKRVAKQQMESAERGVRALVDKLLPVLDVLDLAAAHLGDPASDDGRALVQATALLNDVLAKEGLERIDPVGEPFDPSVHEAVGQVTADATGEPPGPSTDTSGDPETAGDRTGSSSSGEGGDASTTGVVHDGGAEADGADGHAEVDGDTDAGGESGGDSAGGESSDSHEVIVAQVMRAGYRWKGAVVRPAMVMVRG